VRKKKKKCDGKGSLWLAPIHWNTGDNPNPKTGLLHSVDPTKINKYIYIYIYLGISIKKLKFLEFDPTKKLKKH
jgi:hypothetical protein